MCTSTSPVAISLPMDPRAPALMRTFIAQAACELHHAVVLEAARLCVTELVTNAVRHGAAPITCEVECDEGAGMLVRVHDEGPAAPLLAWDPPPALDRVDAAAEGGRGLGLVDLLSDEWGVEPGRYGKAVWFRLSPSGSAPA